MNIAFQEIKTIDEANELLTSEYKNSMHLKVNDSALRKHLHIEAKKYGLLAKTWYKYDGSEIAHVKCDSCKQYSPVINSINGCCGNEVTIRAKTLIIYVVLHIAILCDAFYNNLIKKCIKGRNKSGVLILKQD